MHCNVREDGGLLNSDCGGQLNSDVKGGGGGSGHLKSLTDATSPLKAIIMPTMNRVGPPLHQRARNKKKVHGSIYWREKISSAG